MQKVLVILSCILCSSVLVNAQTVDFNISTSNNLFCGPQAVTFTQNCTGNPDAFIWDFGNGSSGSGATENITFNLPGTYNVSLTATFSNSAFTITKSIVIYPTPTISIVADRNYICQPGIIQFTASGSPFITSYEWDFGDGTSVVTTNTNTTTHNFSSYNNFTVSVRGVTANGCSASTSMPVQVTRFPINASISPSNGCIPSLSTLTANLTLPTGDAGQNFLWIFGDGTANVNTGVNNTTHLYNTTSNITTASVAITTVQGCTNQFNFSGFAFGTPPFNTNAVLPAGRDTFCGSETIQFKARSVNANLYVWDFGDGNIENTSDTLITHKYLTLGNKQIVVTPYFNGCQGERDTLRIYITGVISLYTFSNQCSSKNIFQYNNASLGNISKYYWTFSDNTPIKDSINYNATHTFPTSGNFTTKLYVYDMVTGCSDSLITNQFTATPLLTSSKAKVCKDSAIQYTVNNTYDPSSGFIYEYHLNGNIINGGSANSITILPNNFGTFNDFVVIRNPAGNTCNDTIRLNTPSIVSGPSVNFTTILQQCSINSFPLTNTSFPFFATDSITQWNWTFGDNTKDSVRNPLPHLYTQAGNYTITLIAKDTNNCRQTFSQNISVFPMPYIKTLPKMDTLCLGQTANLFAFTRDTLLWTPNINITCTTCDTTFVTPNFTTPYIAQATNSYGCISYDTSIVKVYRPLNVVAIPSDTTVCPLQLVPLNTNTPGITTWSPASFLSATNIPNPIATPDSSIVYTVIVRDSVGCFADTALARVNTFPRPIVNAGVDTIIPYNNPFTLAPTYSSNVNSYTWSPLTNSLNCSNCPSPSGIARLTETYRIAITSIDGCNASDSIKVYVSCEKSNLYVPTAFTPNNDGVNDYFYPVTRGFKIVNKLTVFNRWGQKVFERNNFAPNIASLGWNGFFNTNKPQQTESYVWYIEATCDLGEKLNTKGTLVLIR